MTLQQETAKLKQQKAKTNRHNTVRSPKSNHLSLHAPSKVEKAFIKCKQTYRNMVSDSAVLPRNCFQPHKLPTSFPG